MRDQVEGHIAAVEAFYEPIIRGPDSRLEGGHRLWRQFSDAVAAYRCRETDPRPLYERINEFVTARMLLNDSTLEGAKISYEPPITTDGRLIDFVVSLVDGETLFVEVKTVHPIDDDSEANWVKYEKRREHHPENISYVVDRACLGAEIYGNSFSARSAFMRYAKEFEERLAEATRVRPGRGMLLICGTGSKWHPSELEDFADFYFDGVHRHDDPFSKMEAHALREGDIELRRNISAFGYVRRPVYQLMEDRWGCFRRPK